MPCPSSMSANPSIRRMICTCSNPPQGHDHNCPVLSLNNRQSQRILLNPALQQALNDDRIIQQGVSGFRIYSDDALSRRSIEESMMTTKLMPFTSSNCMSSTSSMADLSNNISQQQQLINNNQVGSVRKVSFSLDNNFQQSTSKFSDIITNPSK